MIDPVPFINKIYYVYQKRFNKFFASIDTDSYDNYEYIDGKKELKTKMKGKVELGERD